MSDSDFVGIRGNYKVNVQSKPGARQIAELQSQVARLQDAFRIACHIADARRKPTKHSEYYPNMIGEDSLAEMGLLPGDLDSIEGTQS